MKTQQNNRWRDNSNQTVVWADGTYDWSRRCDECGLYDCKFPVHTDHYKEVVQGDDEYVGDYWDFMLTVQPRGAFRDVDGEVVALEHTTANPDELPENNIRNSGISEDQFKQMSVVYDELTQAEKEVWSMVMREQISKEQTAKILGITHQAVNDRLQRAINKVQDTLGKNDVTA